MKRCFIVFALMMSMMLVHAQGSKDTMNVAITRNSIQVFNDITYSQIFGMRSKELKMTVLSPSSRVKKPCIVFYPGGGFVAANHNKYLELRMALAEAGYVVASAEYRTVPDTYPDLIIDAKTAIRYLKAHADLYGIDKDNIAVIGNSAGGYVAQMVATTNGEKQFDQGDYLQENSDVKACCTLFGISNLLNIGEGFSKENIKIHQSDVSTESLLLYGPGFAGNAGGSVMSDRQKALDASPVGHIKENMPPFLIMYGSKDNLVSPVQSTQLYDALTKKGNKADLIMLEGAGHGDATWFQEPVIDRIVSWFEKNFPSGQSK